MAVAVADRGTLRLGQQGPPSASPAEGFGADNGGLLFKHMTPRRRQDQFGRDNTRHADYLLSMAVFPTGVRTPLLSELQKKTEHQCGFEVIDKGMERAGRHVFIQDSKPNSSRRDSLTDSAKKPPPNTPLTASLKLSDRAAHHSSQTFSVSPSSRLSSSKTKGRWAHSSTEMARVSNNSSGNWDGKMKDIRDPLYLNTYCPGERKLRYKKTSLPRISTRNRPWTVSEPNPSSRFARNSKEITSDTINLRSGKSAWPTGRSRGNFRIDASDVMARAKGRAAGDVEDDEEDDEKTSFSGNQALLEVKSYFPNADNVIGDQRDRLRGKEGCLHAKVKQCIKFVKYREKLARCTSVERPLKQEGGRYRPFSTTTIRTPRDSPTNSPIPRHPDPTSVEIYKEYIDTIALQTRLVSAADKRRKPRQATSGIPRYNTAASSYQDCSSALQSVSDSNRPGTSMASITDKPTRASDSPNSAFQPNSVPGDREKDRRDKSGQDPRGVHQALDIIRLSPKAQPPRSSRTGRGGRSERDEEDVLIYQDKAGGREEENKLKSHAIVLPNVSKSATTSVCSFPDESAPAAES